ncbi:MAG: hypothetical protein LUD25_04305 [Coriobacteriaceae bacterium]|nr:hypothetical protein [Coriobacteriaceae bacterium]
MPQEAMPHNLVGFAANPEQAEEEAEEAKSALIASLPAEHVHLRWKYANETIQLYERRLRSLEAYGVGSALRAWIRSRLEWVSDNKLSDAPDGVIDIDIDPEGDVKIDLQECEPMPSFTLDELVWEDDTLTGCTAGATLWVVVDGSLTPLTQQLRASADTLTRDLAKTLGYEICERSFTRDELGLGADSVEPLEDIEFFAVDDEFGLVPCTDLSGEVTQKFVDCFDKLWTLED